MGVGLFDTFRNEFLPQSIWRPEPPPQLDNIDEIYLNFETTGLRWFDRDRPIALSLATPDRRTWYLPWGHRSGNLDENMMKYWAQRELRGKLITNINTRFDVHFAREWGVDFEAQGCTVSDVGHYAALLDDHRQHLNLDSLIWDYLKEDPMTRLDESRMVDYDAGEAAPRSQYNVDAVRRLKEVLWPQLDEQDLQRVRALEDKVIFVVCEMEKNGAPIDVELLDKWIKESQKKYEDYLWLIAKSVGFQVNPDSPKDQERVFKQLGIPITRTATGRPSFTDDILKHIDHPTVQLMRQAGKLASLRSKYLLKYRKTIDSNGIWRYALHQLRATKDEFTEAGEAGTVTGRFSSSAIVEDVGGNIQQEMKVAKQRVSFGYDEDDASHDEEIYVIRRLRIPRSGLWLAADAKQIEYRIFASYANNPKVIQAYRENPDLSFHKFVWELIKPFKALTYRGQKDLNFAKIYGGGLKKLALMLGFITVAQWQELKRIKAKASHPLLKEAAEVERIYNRELPEVDPLLREAGHLAMEECDKYCNSRDRLHQRLDHRGYVKTLLGRRGRFPNNYRTHKALNMVIQGGAADIMKQKLVELHAERKHTGFLMRYTVHDEVDGDAQDGPATAQMVSQILDHQSFPQLRVPILWDVSTGANWAECA